VEGKTGIMKDDEITAGQLSPCVQIFIESLLNADLTTDAARDTGNTENSMDIKKGSRKAVGRSRNISTRLSSERGK
jgi:hypothetical protein